MDKHRNSLQPGYKLHWYEIKSILGQGGFGITYLAEDVNLNQLVAIKEYFPSGLAVRESDASIQLVSGEQGEQYDWGLERFMSEAQTLAKFKHPNIIRVLAVFAENNSAYMVMEYEKGRVLHERLKKGKTLPEDGLKKILLPLLNGLEAVHAAGFIHRDIKPPNIYIREDSSPVLLDFGSARQSLGEHTQTLTSLVSPGYAPFEQYVSKSDRQGPWTDIYGLGATMYRCVTGISPIETMERSESILHSSKDPFVAASEIVKDGYSKDFLRAIDHALVFKPEDRPQSIAEWRQELLTGYIEPVASSSQTNNKTSEAETIALTEKTEILESDSIQSEDKYTTSLFSRTMDSLNHTIYKLLKWSVIFLVIIIIYAILKNDKPIEQQPVKQAQQEETTSTVKDRLENVTDESKPEVTADPVIEQVQDSIKPDTLVPQQERLALQYLRSRVKNNPQDKQARKDLRQLAEKMGNIIEIALENKRYELAEDYIKEILKYATDGSKRKEELLEILNRVQLERSRSK